MRLCRTALVLLPAAAPAAAQSGGSDVPLGTRVRVHTRGDRLTGALAGVRGDTLLVRQGPDSRAVPVAIPFAAVRQLEVSDGVRTRAEGARRGALVGLLVAGVPSYTAVGIAYHQERRNPSNSFISATAAFTVLGTMLTVTSTAVGAIVGYNRPRERWEEAVLPRRVGAAVLPAPGGAALAVRVGF